MWWAVGLAAVLGAIYLMATAETGPVDPTELGRNVSSGTIIFNASMIVFREGLEAVLILAAITAGMRGEQAARRRPIALGAGVSLLAAVATWFAVVALLDVASPLGARLEAITGFVAIVVILLIMNWFVHKLYWTGWIAKHNKQKREVLGRTGLGVTAGLVALGFTSVYREGFEVVLFLQNLRLQDGTPTVLAGVGIGFAATVVVGILTFALQQRLPYKKLLWATGILIGVVLVTMVGGTVLAFQDLGWLPSNATPFTVPTWTGAWFEVYSTWEGLAFQFLAAAFVIGSYGAAERMKRRQQRQQRERAAAVTA